MPSQRALTVTVVEALGWAARCLATAQLERAERKEEQRSTVGREEERATLDWWSRSL